MKHELKDLPSAMQTRRRFLSNVGTASLGISGLMFAAPQGAWAKTKNRLALGVYPRRDEDATMWNKDPAVFIKRDFLGNDKRYLVITTSQIRFHRDASERARSLEGAVSTRFDGRALFTAQVFARGSTDATSGFDPKNIQHVIPRDVDPDKVDRYFNFNLPVNNEIEVSVSWMAKIITEELIMIAYPMKEKLDSTGPTDQKPAQYLRGNRLGIALAPDALGDNFPNQVPLSLGATVYAGFVSAGEGSLNLDCNWDPETRNPTFVADIGQQNLQIEEVTIQCPPLHFGYHVTEA